MVNHDSAKKIKNSSGEKTTIDVVAVALYDQSLKQYFIAQRNSEQSGAGYWEFPGGKIEPNESAEHAVVREIKEELNVDLSSYEIKYVIDNTHEYENKIVHLLLYKVLILKKEVEINLKLVDHSDFSWVRRDKLLEFNLAPADQPFVKSL